MPGQEKTEKERKIHDLDPHLKKCGQGPGVEVGVDRHGRQGEGKGHDQDIRKLKGIEK
jgi:hypothetical protein